MDSHKDVAKLLDEAATLSARAAALAAEGKVQQALELESQADSIRRRARLRARRPARAELLAGRGTGRDLTIASLNELGVPSSPKDVADYAFARFAQRLDYRALASLRRDEQRTWQSPRSLRPVYIVPALEGRRFLPIRGKVTLSEWPLDRRVIGPWSERVDHLKATLNVATQYAWVSENNKANSERLGDLLRTLAATIPGAATDRKIDLNRLQRAAQNELEVLAPEDTTWRKKAASRAENLSEQERFWGARPPTAIGGGLE